MPSLDQTWNTHVHVFNHEERPFAATRLYTPCHTSVRKVVESSHCDNFVVVQASFEDGMDGVLDEVNRAREVFPDRSFRAEVFWNADKDKGRDLGVLHELGVRCLRLHGEFGNGSTSLDGILGSLQHLRSIAEPYGWAVAAQLPIRTWISLVPRLGLLGATSAGSRSVIIAEHCGSPAQLPHTPEEAAEFEALIDFLSNSSSFYVKLSALHRRISSDARAEDMAPLIAKLAQQAPHALVYGSDYPHVDVETQSLDLTPLLEVDDREEFRIMQGAMSSTALHSMLVTNAEKIFR